MTHLGSVALVAEDSPTDPRVALLPIDIDRLCKLHPAWRILVQTGAGDKAGYSDDEYRNSGAQIASETTAWRECSIVLKYKAPTERQLALSQYGQTLIGVLHPENNLQLVQLLNSRNQRGIAVEYLRDSTGDRPWGAATGPTTGIQAMLYGAFYMQTSLGGGGRLLTPGKHSRPGEVLVIGHGYVGGAAIEMAVRLGAHVTVAGRTLERATAFRDQSRLQVDIVSSRGSQFKAALSRADVVIGAILISTFDTKPIVYRRDLKSMRPGSVIVDATAGYGSGWVESMPPTLDKSEITRLVDGIVHIKCDHLPLLVFRSAIEEASPTFSNILSMVLTNSNSAVVASGTVCANGVVTNSEVDRHWRHVSFPSDSSEE
jgi:alanine dehydrogenase